MQFLLNYHFEPLFELFYLIYLYPIFFQISANLAYSNSLFDVFYWVNNKSIRVNPVKSSLLIYILVIYYELSDIFSKFINNLPIQ